MKPLRKFDGTHLWPPREARYEELLELIPKFKKIELEIGAGEGRHCIERAQNNPQSLIVGVERTLNKFKAFDRSVKTLKLNNLLHIHSDVIPWLFFLDRKIQLSKVWILYPNPELKSRNRRWIRSPFFAEILSRLAGSSEIELATNLEEYAMEVEQESVHQWNLKSVKNIYQGGPRTLFEKKYLERKETCYQILLKLP